MHSCFSDCCISNEIGARWSRFSRTPLEASLVMRSARLSVQDLLVTVKLPSRTALSSSYDFHA
eukprot:NODE_7111_length_461_cov_1.165025.p2 GENE.NODE_7111_length_461_cov_1.165025~~NODE_7111_length_461_cov_1.165025.p2  ORF type:complete len:63 (+),score=1.32 NODE_7111_length_461_cov_1.165025:1-189(+)